MQSDLNQSVDDLINQISKLKVDNSNNLNTKNMSTPNTSRVSNEPVQVNIALLRYQADNIPHFDGNPKQLQRFIIASENFLRNFQNIQNPADPINICIFDTVLSKLTGRAADLVGSRTELKNWHDIKTILNITFSDQRSIDCLIQDLISIKPFKNETPMQLGMRIQDARSLLISKLNSSIDDDREKIIKIEHYNDFALKTFINGLPYQMQLVVRLRQPDSLEEALSYVVEEENFKYFSTGQNQNLHHTTYKPQHLKNFNHNKTQQSFPKPYFNQHTPQFNHYNTPNLQSNNFQAKPNFNNNFTRPNFSPFNNNHTRFNFNNHQRPNWQPNNRFPTQQSPAFSQQRNSAIIRNQNPRAPYKPEPMDTSSGNTILKSKPKYVTQELFAQQINNELDSEQPSTSYASDYHPTNYYDQNECNSERLQQSTHLFDDEENFPKTFYRNNQT